MVAYRFEDSRAGDRVARHLSEYRGILQVHGHGAYNKLARSDGGNDGVILAGCWSHCKRKFYELHASDSSRITTQTVELMAKLSEVEAAAAVKALTAVSRRGRRPLLRLSLSSSPFGRRPCRGSPASRSLPRRSSMPHRVAPSSSASSPTAASSSAPTSLSAPSGPRRLRERTVSSLAAMAVEGHGRRLPRSFRRRR